MGLKKKDCTYFIKSTSGCYNTFHSWQDVSDVNVISILKNVNINKKNKIHFSLCSGISHLFVLGVISQVTSLFISIQLLKKEVFLTFKKIFVVGHLLLGNTYHKDILKSICCLLVCLCRICCVLRNGLSYVRHSMSGK